MSIVRSLTAAAAVGLSVLPLQALAQGSGFDLQDTPAVPVGPPPQNSVTVGGMWQSNTSAYFGRYNGHPDNGLYGIGAFDLNTGDAWDSGGTQYLRATGSNLGFDSRSASVSFGYQGLWGVTLFYDGIPYWGSIGLQSVWTKGGALVPGVAPGSINNTRLLTNRLRGIDIDTQRDIFGGNGKFEWGDWTITTGIRHEHKTGTLETALYFGSAPISPTTANLTTGAFGSFAAPVDYDTDRYDIAADYVFDRLQVRLGYTYNSFTDNNSSIALASPFAFTTGYGGAASRVSAVFSLPPSNSAHQVKAQVGYDITPTTRLNINGQYGLMLQNASLPAATGNINLAPLTEPGSNIDATVQTIFANVALTSTPIPKLNLRLSYTIDERDNMTPRNLFSGYAGDTSSLVAQYNLPLSYRHQTLRAEAGYRLAPETKVTLIYAFDDIKRSYADTEDVTENSVQAKVRTALTDSIYGSLSYLHGARVAHNYNQNSVYYYLGIAPSDFTGLVKYYEASRNRDEVKASLDVSPVRDVSAMLSATFRNDQYPDTSLGLRSNYNVSVGPDIGWQIRQGLSLHAYYTYERYYFEQNDVYFTTSSCNSNGVTISATCNGLWNGKTTDDSHTVGVNLEWAAIPDRLKLNADYVMNYGNAAYSLANGGLLALGGVANASNVVSPGPTVRSLLNSVTLRAEYKLRPNVSLVGAYTYANFTTNDYAYGQAATQYTNALFPGANNTSYNEHLILAAITAHW